MNEFVICCNDTRQKYIALQQQQQQIKIRLVHILILPQQVTI